MKPIRITLWALLIGLSLLWIASSPPLSEAPSFIALRNLALQYSGVLAIGSMSLAMILAVRSPRVNRWLNGLDKSYRLHKWLGIAALVAAVFHWITANGPKWAVSWGLMTAPERRPHGSELPEFGTVQTFLVGLRHTAESLGEWAFYAAAALIAIALVKRIPYRFFAKSHTLIALAYLVLVFHSIVLMNFDAWTQPVGVVTALMMLGGVGAAALALTRQIGRRRQVPGRIAALRRFPSMKVTEAEVTVDANWPGHEAGQFAFVTFDRREGPHPFTIASAWTPANRSVTFISKGLGDYTERLPETVSVGDDITIEGPYGRFTFEDGKERQIWIGAGIGITPFIARLKHLATNPDGRTVDLFHTVPEIAAEPKALLEVDVAGAGVALHLMEDRKDGRLTGARLREMLPDWSKASVWFCGPAAFGETLRRDLVAHGLRSADFHQELFNMR
ncbi:ferric reductase-like transmembrane domain-containing protein [Paralimibaculum aggregatum]|uniref:Ferric reductase-like transmembrane domain-containing protein n=1 Tax=Paralimibaculum aggregatum TaxID=3036245 RepID=A0ABQ6LRR4_9RHOB|nr:ferric reductase-like transmembrane domain-containing protein [Limibaculum sp. NKW23]GMG84503.1 ferric reductase-like transmembrane domain-containing protein [Limibaculum sp. NKW23]